MMQENLHYAGLWIRLLADAIDSVILDLGIVFLLLVFLGVFSLLGGGLDGGVEGLLEAFHPVILQGVFLGLRGLFALGYYTYGHYRFRTTFGKKIFNIKVVDAVSLSSLSFRQSLVRSFGYLLSYLTLGIGFLVAAFHPRKQALHDHLAGSFSIVRP